MSLSSRLIRAVGLAAAITTLGVSGASSVTTADFYLAGHGGLATSYSFNVNGIGLTVTAGTFDGSGVSDGAYVGQYNYGLGVTSDPDRQHFVDGYGSNDVLIFAFDRVVHIDKVRFANNDYNDEFRFFYENGGNLVDLGLNIDLPGHSFLSTYVFSGTWVGELFGIGAFDNNDQFKIKKLGVSTVVPLPSALLLILTAMGMLGGVGWKARRSGAAAA